jgi:3-dehydroquinate synthetase
MLDAIEADPYQNRGNRLLDFGHMVAHSLEMESRYAIPHGVAVAADMLLATAVAEHRGICDDEAWRTLVELYRVFRIPLPEIGGDGEKLLGWWAQTRLSSGMGARIAVPTQVGAGQLIGGMTIEDCEFALDRYRQTIVVEGRIWRGASQSSEAGLDRHVA